MTKKIIVLIGIIIVVGIIVVMGIKLGGTDVTKVVKDVEQYIEIQKGNHVEGLDGYLKEYQDEEEQRFAGREELYLIHEDANSLEKETEYTMLLLESCSLGDEVVNTKEGTPEHEEATKKYEEHEKKVKALEMQLDMERVNSLAAMDLDPEAVDTRVIQEGNALYIRYGELKVKPKAPEVISHKGLIKEIHYETLEKETREMRQNNPDYANEIYNIGVSSKYKTGEFIEKKGKGTYIVRIMNKHTKKFKELEVKYVDMELESITKLR